MYDIYDLYALIQAFNTTTNKKCNYYESKKENKCDIIDIANKEMENIDSTEIDTEFDKVFRKETTENLIKLISEKKHTQKDIDNYLKLLNDKDILEIRVSGTSLYIKTNKNIISLSLSNIMGINEQEIELVPILGKNNFYRIDCTKKYIDEEKDLIEDIYDPEELVNIFLDIGGDFIEEDSIAVEKISQLIKQAFESDIKIVIEIKDKIVIISFDYFIPEAKETISKKLFLNPKIFIEVSNPIETVLLVDTRRLYLDPDFGGQEWYL